jgi:hypothetical protein
MIKKYTFQMRVMFNTFYVNFYEFLCTFHIQVDNKSYIYKMKQDNDLNDRGIFMAVW